VADDAGIAPVQEGDRVWVQAPGRRVVGTVRRAGRVTAAVWVEGDGIWLVARDRLRRAGDSGRRPDRASGRGDAGPAS
jgi:hypothetical protein